MKNKDYYFLLFRNELITREELPDSSTALETLPDEKFDRVIWIKQLETLESIKGILTFFMVVFIIGMVITLVGILNMFM